MIEREIIDIPLNEIKWKELQRLTKDPTIIIGLVNKSRGVLQIARLPSIIE